MNNHTSQRIFLALSLATIPIYTAVASLVILFISLFGGGNFYLALYFLLCLALTTQSVIVLIGIKKVSKYVQGIISSLLVGLVPLVLLISTLSIMINNSNNGIAINETIVFVIIGVSILIQITGFIWLRVVYGSTPKKIIQPFKPDTPQSTAPIPPISEPLSHNAAANSTIVRPKTKTGLLILIIPFGIIVLDFFLVIFSTVINITFDGASTVLDPYTTPIISVLTTIAMISFLPCLITGAILLALKK